MTARSRTTVAGAAATALAAGALALGTVAAPAHTGYAAAQRITSAGVGAVKLGRRHSKLHAAGLVGRLRKGCVLIGPGTRSASLRAPLQGSVDLSRNAARRVRRVSITGGAKARGVGVGGSIADIKSAYPKAKLDHSTEKVFDLTLVKIPKDGGGRLQFAVDAKTHKVLVIAVPSILFCD